MSRLVSFQASKKKEKKYVCDFCLNMFGSQELLDDHTEYCSKHDAVNTVMPKPGRNTLKFKNIQNSVECPMKIYADFESFLEPMDRKHGETKLYQRHVPSAFCFYVVSRVEGFSMDPVTYVSQGEDDQVDRMFVEKLEEVTKKIYETFKESKPMIFDEAARKLHERQHEYYACGKKFDEKMVGLKKVRDHCHYTGKYRGALHSKCNLRLKRMRTIPVFFHNLTGYDCHLFVKRLADSLGDVNCIPRNEEKYVTFNKMVLVDTMVKGEKEVNIYSSLKFVDTMNFMRTSLEKLVENLEKPSFKHTGKYLRGKELDLMLRKGIYPYEYMTVAERLCEKSLQSKEEFASLLGAGVILESEAMITPSDISDEDYERAQKVFEAFGRENLADYTRLYCKSDVLLLADVFENFIDVCLGKYEFGPLPLHHRAGLVLGRHVEDDGCQAETSYGQRHAPVLRGRYSRGNFHDNEQVREGQPQVREKLRPGGEECIHPVPGRQQSLRVGDEPAPPVRKLRVARRERYPYVHEVSQMDQVVHTGGQPRISERVTRPSQRLPAWLPRR